MRIISKPLLILTIFYSAFSLGQTENNYIEKGQFSLGVRSTTSLFGHDNAGGLGTGGQFRLQLFDFLSTEFFADWITIDLNGAGTRKDAHIGWSVLFYPKKFGRIQPYLIAGHCFDYAEVTPLSTSYIDRSSEQISRWSSAVQAGLGTHLFLSNRMNISFAAQYMLHVGQHLEYELIQTVDNYYLNTNPSGITTGSETEGHLLLTLSLNYRIADLW